jgi:uncharacterized protein (DUF4415 family)
MKDASTNPKNIGVSRDAPLPTVKLRVWLDSDVIDWLKKQGKGYQSRMNAILRREMLASLKTTAK